MRLGRSELEHGTRPRLVTALKLPCSPPQYPRNSWHRFTRAASPAGTGIQKAMPPPIGRGIDFPRKTAAVLGICLLVGFLNFSLDAAAAVNRVTVLPGPLANLCRVLVPAA